MRRFSELPATTRALWAKSGVPIGHGLLAHMLDVAAVAEAILDRESAHTRQWAGTNFGIGIDEVPRGLAAICGLHDFGKAIPGFQAKWPEGKQNDEAAGLSFAPAAAMKADRHDLASAYLLQTQFAKRFPHAGWAPSAVLAVASHHGYVFRTREIRGGKPLFEPAIWAEAREALLDSYIGALTPFTWPATAQLDVTAASWLAGLTSLADWIGSNPPWFPAGERADVLTDYHQYARELAKRALKDIGWPAFALLLTNSADTDALVSCILGRPDQSISARPLQRAADRLLEDRTGPLLMIVEAPMGEGKTELAFLAHLRLQCANGHRGDTLASIWLCPRRPQAMPCSVER